MVHLLVVLVVLVVPVVLVVLVAIVVLLREALVVLTVLILEINPLRMDLQTVLHHDNYFKNLYISLLMVLLVLICPINTTNTYNLIVSYLS